MWRDLEGSGCVPNLGIIAVYAWLYYGKLRNIPANMTGVTGVTDVQVRNISTSSLLGDPSITVLVAKQMRVLRETATPTI